MPQTPQSLKDGLVAPILAGLACESWRNAAVAALEPLTTTPKASHEDPTKHHKHQLAHRCGSMVILHRWYKSARNDSDESSMPKRLSTELASAGWRTTSLKKYPPDSCSLCARLFEAWATNHHTKPFGGPSNLGQVTHLRT